eukprot:762433-Hanusia_phi.AAC.7
MAQLLQASFHMHGVDGVVKLREVGEAADDAVVELQHNTLHTGPPVAPRLHGEARTTVDLHAAAHVVLHDVVAEAHAVHCHMVADAPVPR